MSDLNYTLLEEVLSIGGEIRQSIIAETGEVVILRDAQSAGAGRAARNGVPLSTLHIRPFLEFYAGAGLLKVSSGVPGNAPIGGKKGKISGFSFASRRALLRLVSTVKFDSFLPMFCTITYPDIFPDAIESKRQLKIFIQRLLRAFPEVGGIWKLEPQERGAPHYHFLLWGVSQIDLFNFFVEHWHDIAGGGDPNHKLLLLGALKNSKPCVEAVRSRNGVLRYASKYLAKTFEVSGWNNSNHGRYWGLINRENIPFGVKCVYEIPLEKANHIMRYQRRFAGLKGRSYKSLTTFADANQWVENIFSEVIKEK